MDFWYEPRRFGGAAEIRQRCGGEGGREILILDRNIQTGGGRLQVSSEATEMDIAPFSPPRLPSVWGEGDPTSWQSGGDAAETRRSVGNSAAISPDILKSVSVLLLRPHMHSVFSIHLDLCKH